MSSRSLPNFAYHPDPVATGSVVASSTVCIVCRRARGFIYRGPVYGEGDYDDSICPWCIADGSAHATLGAFFHDEIAVPGADFPDAPRVARAVVEEVCYRTPGFSGWQQEQWFTCCDDAGAFLGRAGRLELETQWPEAIPALRSSTGLDGEAWSRFFEALHRDHGPRAYVFRCRHCQRFGAYQDMD